MHQDLRHLKNGVSPDALRKQIYVKYSLFFHGSKKWILRRNFVMFPLYVFQIQIADTR